MSSQATSYSGIALDASMRRILALLEQVAPTTLPVLLVGESGVGKELLAEWLHRVSPQAAASFLKVNCAGLSESLIESELFGHEPGAFPGAEAAYVGAFERAAGGLVFLDEIAELPARTQAKLLRVIETGEFTRLGSTQSRMTDSRVVSATHRDLPRLIVRGEFRGDLFFRLRGVVVEVPPLRSRPSEIVPLAELFMRRCAETSNREPLILAADAAAALLAHDWPGNVRELRHAIELSVALSAGDTLTVQTLKLALTNPGARLTSHAQPYCSLGAEPDTGKVKVQDMRAEQRAFERLQIRSALEATRGNQTSAAKLLGISRRALCAKLTLHGFERPRLGRIRTSSSGQSDVETEPND